MQENYTQFVDRMIKLYEGGYGWDKGDPGGPTKYGITCYDLAEYLDKKMDSMSKWAPIVKNMSLATAEIIYQNKYAKAIHFDDLKNGIDCCMMDYAVNSGIGRAIRVAQAICDVTVDGRFGPKTTEALSNQDPDSFIDKMCDERMKYLHSLKIWSTFGKGWTARVKDLRNYSHHIINTARQKVHIDVPIGIPNIPAFAVGTENSGKGLPVSQAFNAGVGTGVGTGLGVAAVAAGTTTWPITFVSAPVVAIAGGVLVAWYVHHQAKKQYTTIHI